MKENLQVKLINNKLTYPFLLNIHYAKRIPSISYSFGLFENESLVGVVCYGTPASSTLRKGIAGTQYISKILELNRLCLLDNKPNQASYLVSKSLKMLPPEMIIISFADSSQGHFGYVYQACNFTYHGLSAKRTDWALKSKPNLHGTTIADKSRGKKNRAKYMREFYGDDFYLKQRPRKHRYIYITGKNNKKKKEIFKQIMYKQEPYPKKNIL
jgi:hypothetical protein